MLLILRLTLPILGRFCLLKASEGPQTNIFYFVCVVLDDLEDAHCCTVVRVMRIWFCIDLLYGLDDSWIIDFH
jgi:hypothetical protein